MSRKENRENRSQQVETFEQHADQEQVGIVAEFVDFVLHNKKWWLTPIIVVLLAVTALIVVSGTGLAPFIYTLF